MNNTQKWLLLVSTVLVGGLLYKLSPMLPPFLMSILLAYIADPLVTGLQKKGLSRTLSIILLFSAASLLGLAILLIILPQLEKQLIAFINYLPQLSNWIQKNIVQRFSSLTGINPIAINHDLLIKVLVDHTKQISNTASSMLNILKESGNGIFTWLVYLALIPVVTFYLLRDWYILLEKLRWLTPKDYRSPLSQFVKECHYVLAQFLRGQLLVMFGQAIIYSLGLWIVGLESALLIGVIAGLLSFVPYLGFIVGFGVASIATLMQFGDILHIIYILLVFMVGQTIESVFLSPLLLGNKIGLHPIAVIFAVMAGGQLFGFVGILLALPVSAVVLVGLRHLSKQYLVTEPP